MEEKIFFDKDGVTVSNSRFVVRGQTYAMSGITSVASIKHDNNPSRIGPFIMFFLSFTQLGGVINEGVRGNPAAIFLAITCITFFVIGVKWWRGQKPKPTYEIIFNSSSGRTSALISDNKEYIETIVTALNDAIVSRG